ncbi:MAG: hypothetical protein IID34_15905 [Planctomycetes bacterium]|nr:hypothetical protein [Planctomycetota bacterium]
MTVLILLILLLAPRPVHAQMTWHVDDDCAPPGTGTQVDPFCTIQMGIDAASDGDTVLVQPGTYTGEGNRDISLFGKVITVGSSAGPHVTTIDIQGSPTSIHRGFYLIHGETPATVIEGFSIMNGYLIGDTGGSGPAGGGGGAGIYIRDGSPTIRNCIVRGNISERIGNPFVHDGRGGGIYLDSGSSTLIEDCIIAQNFSGNRGGGILNISDEQNSLTIRNCLITGNLSAPNFPGGGMNNTGSATILNTAFINNNSGASGGGIHNDGSELLLANCILWGNLAGPQFFGDQLGLDSSSTVSITFSDIEGGLGGVTDPGELDWGTGNIDADPLFVDPDNGDFRFLHGSPCVDAGNNLAVPEGVSTDLDGDPRFLDDPTAPDTGNPDPDAPKLPIVDMGPYEYDPDDCNNNGIPDADDLADGTSIDCDGQNGNGIPDDCEADCNNNDQADSCDIALGVSEDCTGNAIPDECEPDCNENGQADTCDLAEGVSEDCTGNGIPDECEPDCNENGAADSCDIADKTSPDCNDNGTPDECEPQADCNGNGQLDSCDIADGTSVDCHGGIAGGDGVPDECCPGDIGAGGTDVGPFDLAVLLASWGACPDSCIEGVPTCACPADFDRNCTVNPFDLAFLLGHWGPCE